MPNIDEIDSFAKIPALEKQGEQFIAILDKIESKFKEVNSLEVKIGGSASGGVTKLLKDQEAAVNSLKEATKAANAEKKRSDQEYVATLKTLLAQRDAEQEKVLKNIREEAIGNKSISLSYKQLSLAYKEAANKAREYNSMLGATHPLTVQANKDALDLSARVKGIDASVGIFNRNVGNYASATSNIQRQIAMFAGELPNIQYGLRTFASSLSNQFQGLFDAIKQATAANKLLREEGKATTSVTRQIVSGIFNWQTGLLALVAVGGVLITWLTSATKEEKAMSEAAKENAASQKQMAESIGKEVSELNLLILKSKDARLSYKERGDAVDELQKRFPEYFAALSRESILNGDVAASVDLATEAIIKKARETQRVEKYTKAISDLARMENELNDINNPAKGTFNYNSADRKGALTVEIALQRQKVKEIEKTLGAQNDVNANDAYWMDAKLKKQHDLNEAKAKANALLTEEQRKERDKKPRAEKEDQFLDEKQAIEAQKLIAENEKMTYEQRYEAAEQFAILSEKLLIKQGQNSIDNTIKYATETDALLKGIEDDKAKDRENELKRLERLSKEEYDIITKRLKEIALEGKESGLNDPEILQNQMSYLSQTLKSLGLQKDEIEKIEEAIKDLRLKQIDAVDKAQDKSDKEKLAKQKKVNRELEKLAQETANFVTTVISASFQRQTKEIEEKGELQDEEYEKEKKAIEDNVKDEDERSAQLKVLADEKAESDKKIREELEQQRRKQQILERTGTIASIVFSTAKAISEAVTLSPLTGGLPFSAIAAAIGAAQVATVLATPMYKDGKEINDPYEGKMIWGEAGTEIKIDKNGVIEKADKATLGYTKKGDRIISNAELKKGLSLQQDGMVNKISYDELIRANARQLGEQTGKIVKAIKQMPQQQDNSAYYLSHLSARK